MQSPVPGFSHSLKAMMAILDKAQAFETAKKLQPNVIPNLRLIADMFPFWRQITIACDHAKGACGRLSGREIPVFADGDMTIAELKARIQATLDFISTIPDNACEGAASKIITVKAGPRELTFPAPFYLHSYAVPNFYFHLTTAYNILRSNGVEIGKVDFLGG